ncbi:MAG: hypothetical protein AAFO82_07750, partial [Bacteroidota bacterium]
MKRLKSVVFSVILSEKTIPPVCVAKVASTLSLSSTSSNVQALGAILASEVVVKEVFTSAKKEDQNGANYFNAVN